MNPSLTSGATPRTPAPRLILLAPMEGVLDHSLRDVLTVFGGIDRCVSEFIRVTDQCLPARVFRRLMPELDHGSRTTAGVPVRGQLLGSDPQCMADNAAVLASLGAEGIDLNFGCPAKTVNRHRGGAVLLDDPELVHRIVAAVRRAVPATLVVSAKMRLGYLDHARMVENAQAIESAGASELVVHARTRLQGYRPPAYWPLINTIRTSVRLPVVANGDIWTAADAHDCMAQSGCDALMLGRGALSNPGLPAALRGLPTADWAQVLRGLRRYATLITPRVAERHRGGRLKQWLNMLRRHYPQAQAVYSAVRELRDIQSLEAALFGVARDGRDQALPATHRDAEAAVF